jgi:hypothetical protein
MSLQAVLHGDERDRHDAHAYSCGFFTWAVHELHVTCDFVEANILDPGLLNALANHVDAIREQLEKWHPPPGSLPN